VDSVVEAALGLIESIGEVGVGLLIALESVVPPIPSEVVLPFAGFAAAQGLINPWLAWLAATLGALAGAYLLYGLGVLLSYERLHDLAGRRWFLLFGQRDLERGHRLFLEHGEVLVLVGRCVPLIRSIVSVPAGLTGMPLWRFSLLTAAGSGVWNGVFIFLGYRLEENYTAVERYAAPISRAVVAMALLGLVWLAVRRIRQHRRGEDAAPLPEETPSAPEGGGG
jgi:membrane protein DedA with SNARE-associated domain